MKLKGPKIFQFSLYCRHGWSNDDGESTDLARNGTDQSQGIFGQVSQESQKQRLTLSLCEHVQKYFIYFRSEIF